MTQTEEVLSYIRRHGSITPLEALQNFGCFRLGARIYDLKRAGVNVDKQMIEQGGKRFACYSEAT